MTVRPGGGLGCGPVATVIFDYGLTLVDLRSPAAAIARAQAGIADLIAAAGHPRPSPRRLQTAVHDRVAAEVADHEAGGALDEIDVAELERRAFADIGLVLETSLLDDCSRRVQEAWLEGVVPYPDTRASLQELRDMGMRCGLCSNAPYRVASMHAQLRHLHLAEMLDACVFSAEVGRRKPAPELFRAVLEALGAEAGRTVFVGDRLREDVAGAQAVGMRAVLVDRGRHDHQTLSAVTPNAVITSLRELPPMLADLVVP